MRKASLGTLFLTVFLDLLGFGLVIPFLPGVARTLGAGDIVAPSLAAAFSLMQFFFIPIWGRLSDRHGRRRILLISILANAVGMTLLGFANSIPMLLLARLWSGIATSNLSVAQAYVADVTTPETRAKGMGMLGVAFGLGFIFGPFIGGELGRVVVFGREGPLAAFTAAGLSLLNFGLAIKFLPESLPPEARAGKPARRLSPLDFSALRAAVKLPAMALCAAITFFMTFFFSGLEVTFRLFTADTFSLTIAGTGRVFAVMGVTAAVTQGGLVGPLTRRLGERRLLFSGLLVLALGFAGIAFSRDLGSLGFAVFMVAAVVVALGNGMSHPSLTSYMSRNAPPSSQGITLGVMHSLSALARAVGPLAGGALYGGVSVAAPYVVGAIGIVGAAALSRFLPAPRT